MIAHDELIIDNFAGGGGASTAIRQALGRPVDIAINHDPQALSMHAANHPETLHLCEGVWAVDIIQVVAGRKVGLAWFSPDCKHFSKAKGGKPVEKNIRGLAWVALRWAGLVNPRVIVLENVEEFKTWGPVLANGKPCKKRKGSTFRKWVAQLRALGYTVDWREIVAAKYGASTIRKRLFIVARLDVKKIEWPAPTHGPGLIPYRTAAECIDWSIPCPSIFLNREEGRKAKVNRPLANKTMLRIARGVKKYVLETGSPFIVALNHGDSGGRRVYPMGEPLRTLTRTQGEALVVPSLIQTGYGEREGQSPRCVEIHAPLGTIVGTGKNALVSTFLAKHFGGATGVEVDKPLPTITARGTQTQLVATSIMKMRGTNTGSAIDEPLHTVSAAGTHHAMVQTFLIRQVNPDTEYHLVRLGDDRYYITDIGMRMLTPRELFLAQGFPADYIIDRGRKILPDNTLGEWIPLKKTAQIRMCGNSVSPFPAKAIIETQFGRLESSSIAA